ncbi:hypothetical protein DFS34DRAFT_266150 [Phlyctochytrium arcticum]|nr:hypothetical protein DFS34DRAFT_266150 [Phlyctochytrium arcticum]
MIKIGQFASMSLDYVVIDDGLAATPTSKASLQAHNHLIFNLKGIPEYNHDDLRKISFVFPERGNEYDVPSGLLITLKNGGHVCCYAPPAEVGKFYSETDHGPLSRICTASLTLTELNLFENTYENISLRNTPHRAITRSTRSSIVPKVPTRVRISRSQSRSAPPKTNERLFRYPLEGPNSITVHEHDYNRLQDGEFLNDVVIDFCMKNLIINIPDEHLRDQIHVFSTFFYEQLSTKADASSKSGGSGYDRVKKWTSKVDIFKKKYIFVPINENMHWYLALIYNPGAMLGNQPIDVDSDEDTPPSSAIETSIEQSDVPMENGSADSSAATNDSIDLEHSEPDPVHTVESQETQSFENVIVASDDDEDPISLKPRKRLKARTRRNSLSAEDKEKKAQKELRKRKEKAQEAKQKCNIIILDSLGNQHLGAINRLKGYLVKEAETKLQTIIESKNASGIHAKVPQQNNHCDCGIYLLFYVEVFLRDPKTYLDLIFGRAVDNKKWFMTRDVRDKRAQIRNQMDELKKDYQARLTASKTASPAPPASPKPAKPRIPEENNQRSNPSPPSPPVADDPFSTSPSPSLSSLSSLSSSNSASTGNIHSDEIIPIPISPIRETPKKSPPVFLNNTVDKKPAPSTSSSPAKRNKASASSPGKRGKAPASPEWVEEEPAAVLPESFVATTSSNFVEKFMSRLPGFLT